MNLNKLKEELLTLVIRTEQCGRLNHLQICRILSWRETSISALHHGNLCLCIIEIFLFCCCCVSITFGRLKSEYTNERNRNYTSKSEVNYGTDDVIRPWLDGFVEQMGM